MGIPVLSIEPTSIRAGDSVAWTRTLTDYAPADGWAVAYTIIGADAKYSIAATGSGSTHSVALAAADTDGFASGRYSMVGVATKGADRVTIYSGPIEILPDLAAAATYDVRSHARRMLDAIEAALESRATRDQLDLIEVSVYSRTQRRDRSALIEARSRYMIEVARESAAAGVAPASGRVMIRF